jgi:signal transduction histidine kinase
VRRFQPITDQKGLYLRAEVCEGGENVCVVTDRQKLERIIANLVDNAIKYTEHGGVTVGLVQQQQQSSGGDGEQVVVRVSDTGIGIPRENVPFLFDEFYQVNNYERDRSKGFGMGLAICRCLARHIAGDVRLASTGPQGSCFEIVIADVEPDVGGGRSAGEGKPGERPDREDVGAHRGGRPGGAPGRRADPEAARLCRV